jgi:hypothetical protein
MMGVTYERGVRPRFPEFERRAVCKVLARHYSSMSTAMKATKPMKARASVRWCSMAITGPSR